VRDGFRHQTPIKVRFNETDLQGHVNFGHHLFYFDVGLTEYMDAIGYSYARMLEEGADMVYVEAHCRYRSPARWPEVLQVHTRLDHIGRRSLRFAFAIQAAGDGRLVAEGHIAASTVARATLDPLPVPEAMRRAAEAYEGVSYSAESS
jgi:acyl-CoA thioester hydrolase